MAIKSVSGARPSIQVSRGKVKGGRLWLVGTDTVKTTLFSRLQHSKWWPIASTGIAAATRSGTRTKRGEEGQD
jgi:hypothetical protein